MKTRRPLIFALAAMRAALFVTLGLVLYNLFVTALPYDLPEGCHFISVSNLTYFDDHIDDTRQAVEEFIGRHDDILLVFEPAWLPIIYIYDPGLYFAGHFSQGNYFSGLDFKSDSGAVLAQDNAFNRRFLEDGRLTVNGAPRRCAGFYAEDDPLFHKCYISPLPAAYGELPTWDGNFYLANCDAATAQEMVEMFRRCGYPDSTLFRTYTSRLDAFASKAGLKFEQYSSRGGGMLRFTMAPENWWRVITVCAAFVAIYGFLFAFCGRELKIRGHLGGRPVRIFASLLKIIVPAELAGALLGMGLALALSRDSISPAMWLWAGGALAADLVISLLAITAAFIANRSLTAKTEGFA